MSYQKISKKDHRYPERLRDLHDAPEVLYVRGDPALLNVGRTLGVVGSRHMSSYGEQIVEQFIPAIVSHGIAVISGLAFGVDAASHQCTLRCHGSAIAVLGSGIERITPVAHERLGEQIAESGLLVSEYPGKTPAAKFHFPARNRIVAGLSDALIVIEGTRVSGSLITADFMLQLGRQVFAIPGPLGAPLSEGPNMLIQNGAHPALGPDDILAYFGISPAPTNNRNDLDVDEQQTWQRIPKNGISFDELQKACTLPQSTLAACLTTLELKHAIKKTSEGTYIRI